MHHGLFIPPLLLSCCLLRHVLARLGSRCQQTLLLLDCWDCLLDRCLLSWLLILCCSKLQRLMLIVVFCFQLQESMSTDDHVPPAGPAAEQAQCASYPAKP